MAYPYDRRSPRQPSGQVPLHLAQQWAEEQRRLRAEIERLRKENEALAHRAEEAEDAAVEMRATLEQQAMEARSPQQPALSEEDARRISRLSHRVEELTGDLERVQRRSTESEKSARLDERRRLLVGIGDILDSIERGLDGQENGPWRQGLEAIRSQFLAFLSGEGVLITGESGQALDPNLHQAIGLIEADGVEAGHIARVDRPGLIFVDGTVIRPALVTVAR
jgi:molecular chaperone GrpE